MGGASHSSGQDQPITALTSPLEPTNQQYEDSSGYRNQEFHELTGITEENPPEEDLNIVSEANLSQLEGSFTFQGSNDGSRCEWREKLDDVCRSPSGETNRGECPICMTEFDSPERRKVESKLEVLNCKHAFHANCITEWLERSNTCPICRTVFLVEGNTSKAPFQITWMQFCIAAFFSAFIIVILFDMIKFFSFQANI